MRQNQNTIAVIDHKRLNFWQLSKDYFGCGGHALVTVAVVERLPLWRGGPLQCRFNCTLL